jgi:hypothetical protein
MKNEKLLEKIGEISEDYIAEANPTAKTIKERPWVKWGVLAACLALAALAVIKIVPAYPVGPVTGRGDLPMLEITEDSGKAMGFEGYMAYDISEIVNNNPWTDTAEISTLPVYKNVLSYDENYQISGADFDKMKELLLTIASRLGMDAAHLEITDNAPDEKTQAAITEKFAETGERAPEGYFSPSAVIIEDNGIEIEVDQQMTATITFDPAIALPDEYNFTPYATYEQVAAVADYLKEAYKDFIGMDDPKVNIHGGDYAVFSGEERARYGVQQAQDYGIEFYDGSGDITSQIINYNFNRVAFYCDDDGKLFLARVFQPDLSGKVGDYPIITADEAKELLEKGNSITTVAEEFPGSEYVAKVELVYFTDGTEHYFMPYYRFSVELSEKEGNGLKTYGAYYAPAVEGAYLSTMPA